MTVAKLKRFGLLQKTFGGRGVLKFHDGTEVSAKFTVAQLSSIDLVFTAYIDLPQWKFDDLESGVVGLFGKLTDGHSASINGLFIKYVESGSLLTKTHLTGYASNFTFGISEFETSASVSFEITNFLFFGNEFEKKMIGNVTKTQLSLLNLKLDDKEVAVRQMDEYQKIEIELRAQKRVKATCIATTTIKNSSEIKKVVETIDNLCDVMSIARSTLVSWTSYDITSQDGQIIFSTYRNSVTRNYSGSAVISNNDVKNTKAFLEKAFSQHKTLSEQYNVRQLARAYTETRDGGFIESRSMLIGVLIEYIASVQARLDNRSNFLPTDIFELHLSEFNSRAKDLLLSTYPEVKSSYVSTMMNIIKGFNRRPFSWKLNGFAKKFSVKVKHGEIDKIVTTRNKLAHEGRFSGDETPVVQYLRMQHFVDRVLLRLFDYHGPYYDLEHNKTDEI